MASHESANDPNDPGPPEPRGAPRSSGPKWGVALVILLGVAAGIVPVAGGAVFPDNGGFTRNVMFVCAREAHAAYYLLVDEFHTTRPVTLLFHGRGQFLQGPDSVAWVQGGDRLNLTFRGPGNPVETIESRQGYLYEHHAREAITYARVHLAAGTPFLVTVAHFTPAGAPFPCEGSEDEVVGTWTLAVNASDALTVNAAGAAWTRDSLQTDARLFLALDGNTLDRNASDAPGGPIVAVQASRVHVNGTLVHAGPRATFQYENGTRVAANFRQGAMNRETDIDAWETAAQSFTAGGKNEEDVGASLYFTEAELPELRARVHGTSGPWPGWYQRLGADVLGTAFRARVEEDTSLVQHAATALTNLSELYAEYARVHDMQDIGRSTFLADYVLAYDMIRANLSRAVQADIEGQLHPLVSHLHEAHAWNVTPLNNHLVVTAVALGLAGLLLDEAAWVAEARRSVEFYLRDDRGIRPNGACYEGAHYAYYTFKHAVKFFHALARAGGPNFFHHPKYLAFLNFTVASMCPPGTAPVFEDAAINRTMSPVALASMAAVADVAPGLAGHLRWLYELDPSPHYYGVHDIVLYSRAVAPVAPSNGRVVPGLPGKGANPGFIYPTDGYAVFRSDWAPTAHYLILSNKPYLQSHVHGDENSFELYAFGKKWIANPGYPGWGRPGHDYVMSTEGSNSILVGGAGQVHYAGEGFTDGLQTARVDFVSSPTRVTYRHPFHPGTWAGFAWWMILLGLAVAVTGGAELAFRRLRGHARDQDHTTVPHLGDFSRDGDRGDRGSPQDSRGDVPGAGTSRGWVVPGLLGWAGVECVLVPLLLQSYRTILHVKIDVALRAQVLALVPVAWVLVAVLPGILALGWTRRRDLRGRRVLARFARGLSSKQVREAWQAGTTRALPFRVARLGVVAALLAPKVLFFFDQSMVDGGSFLVNGAILANAFGWLAGVLLALAVLSLAGRAWQARVVGKQASVIEEMASGKARDQPGRAERLRAWQARHVRAAGRGWSLATLALLLGLLLGMPAFYALGFESVSLA